MSAMEEPTPKKPGEPLIRLHPVGPLPPTPPVGRPLPQFVLKDDGTDISDEFLPAPIPESPPHICPICDYNLTGLKRRRCPECGELFELYEARRHGAKMHVRGRQDWMIARMNWLALVMGLVLFFGSITTGSIMLRDSKGHWPLWLVVSGALVAAWVFMFRVYFGKNRAHTVFAAGLIMATLVGMMLVLML